MTGHDQNHSEINDMRDEIAASVDSKQSEEHDIESSDGGFRAWLQVVGGFLVFFNIWGFPISFGAYQNFYELHYLKGYSASSISWIGTTQGFLLITVGILGGPLYDLGYFRQLVYIGSLLTVFGIMMLSLSTEYWEVFLSQGVCAGLGCGLLYIPSLALVGGAFEKNRVVAMGIMTSGVALGGVVYTIMFQQLLPNMQFPWTTRIMAFTALATFLMAIPLLLWSPASSTPASSTTHKARALIEVSALKSPSFVLFTLAQFLIFAGYLVPLFYIPVFGQVSIDLSNEFSLWVLVIAQAMSLAGRVGTGLLAKHVGSMVVWIVCCGLSGILCLIWTAIDDLGGFIAFGSLYGIDTGALVSLPPTIFPLVSPDPATLGTRMGMSWAATAVAFLIGSPIAGALAGSGAKMDFTGIQVWSGVLLLVGAAVLGALWVVFVREMRRRDIHVNNGSQNQRTIWI